ncbi:MAG: hypothetical protein ACYC6N_10125 [Pirellulaceae bacterium]
MTKDLLPPTFLFRFSLPCHYRRTGWNAAGANLEPKFRLPCFGELEGKTLFADVRAAWNRTGLLWTLQVTGKKQTPWCRASRVEESDGLHLWIDTRDTHNIHRASRYCHRFVFLPAGAGPQFQQPVGAWLPINRARDNPKPVAPESLQVRSHLRADGYTLDAHVPATALTGFDPAEYPRLGFCYAVVDRELGWQTLSVGTELPFLEDPSLWGSLALDPAP